MRPTLLLCALGLLALPFHAAASDCTTWSTSSAEHDTNPSGIEGVPRYYVVDDHEYYYCKFFCYWIYEETNGIDGLQRGDEIVDDTCHGMIEADTVFL